jgi:hypothetical protein
MKLLRSFFLIFSFLFNVCAFATIRVDREGDKYSIVEQETVDFDKYAVYFTKFDGWYSSFFYTDAVVISNDEFDSKFNELKRDKTVKMVLYKGKNKQYQDDLLMWISYDGSTEYLSEQFEKEIVNGCYH